MPFKLWRAAVKGGISALSLNCLSKSLMRQRDRSLPSPLPLREQKKGLFKHPSFPFFFSLRSLCSAIGTFVCLYLCSEGPPGKGPSKSRSLGMGSQARCVHADPSARHLRGGMGPFWANRSSSRIRHAKHLGSREEMG